MKILPFILFLPLIGCSRSSQQAALSIDEVKGWVPMGTSLDSARHIMEQRHYSCSVVSYDKPEQMGGFPEAHLFGGFVIKDGSQQIVTNVSYLDCTQSQVTVHFILCNAVTYGVGVGFKQ